MKYNIIRHLMGMLSFIMLIIMILGFTEVVDMNGRFMKLTSSMCFIVILLWYLMDKFKHTNE